MPYFPFLPNCTPRLLVPHCPQRQAEYIDIGAVLFLFVGENFNSIVVKMLFNCRRHCRAARPTKMALANQCPTVFPMAANKFRDLICLFL